MIGTRRKRAHGPSRRLGSILLVLAALTAAAALAQVPRPVAVDLGAVRALVPALERPGGRILSLKGVGAALGWRLHSTPAGDFELVASSEAATLRFPADLPGLVQGPRAFWTLKREAVRSEGDLFVAREDLDLVRSLLERAAEAGGSTAPRLRLGEAAAGAADLEMRVSPAGDLSPVEPSVERDVASGSWRVLFPGLDDPGWPWSLQRLDHPLLAGVRLEADENGSTVVLEPGPQLESVTVDRAPSGGAWRIAMAARPGPSSRPGGSWTEDGPEIRRIVLDPGHGGEEDGAIGPGGVVEKDLVLDVARRARAKLRTRGFEVHLTREGDVGLPLDARAGIANREKADLFVSIHANAARYRGARGAETYFLAREATDDAARTAAALENNASGARLDGTLDGDLPLILWDMAQTEYLEESQQLAELIQARLNQTVNLEDRGVRQAPFRVLVGATCPAVLVELGFLSHPEEEALLAQPAYRDRLASALTEALETFARAQRVGASPSPGPREPS
jgi:N-acetylmuramoyl-L-alanine amidase